MDHLITSFYLFTPIQIKLVKALMPSMRHYLNSNKADAEFSTWMLSILPYLDVYLDKKHQPWQGISKLDLMALDVYDKKSYKCSLPDKQELRDLCSSICFTKCFKNISETDMTSFVTVCEEFSSQRKNSTSRCQHRVMIFLVWPQVGERIEEVLNLNYSSFYPAYKWLYALSFHKDLSNFN